MGCCWEWEGYDGEAAVAAAGGGRRRGAAAAGRRRLHLLLLVTIAAAVVLRLLRVLLLVLVLLRVAAVLLVLLVAVGRRGQRLVEVELRRQVDAAEVEGVVVGEEGVEGHRRTPASTVVVGGVGRGRLLGGRGEGRRRRVAAVRVSASTEVGGRGETQRPRGGRAPATVVVHRRQKTATTTITTEKGRLKDQQSGRTKRSALSFPLLRTREEGGHEDAYCVGGGSAAAAPEASSTRHCTCASHSPSLSLAVLHCSPAVSRRV